MVHSAEANGLATRFANIRALNQQLAPIGQVQADHAQALLDLCHAAVDEDGAEVLILAGAPLAGLARTLHGQLPVPVVDGVSSALRHAESLGVLAPGKASRGSFAQPPRKHHQGLPAPISWLLGG
ncbi:MAG: aspartate/glutamate racemase family protein [Burkholderiaceae bacterium]